MTYNEILKCILIEVFYDELNKMTMAADVAFVGDVDKSIHPNQGDIGCYVQ